MTRIDIVGGAFGTAKKLMWLTQKFLVSILPATHFFFNFPWSISQVALTILQLTAIKTHPRGYNSVTAWVGSLYLSVWKSLVKLKNGTVWYRGRDYIF